jgi:hypothetical protein
MPIPRRLLPALLSILFVCILIELPVDAPAAVPGGDAYLGYSRLGSDAFYPNVGGLNGWEGALHVKIKPLLGVEGDLAHYGLGADASVPHTTTLLFGPRVTVGVARVRLFLHGLIGGQHSANSSGFSDGAFAWGFGGGVDVPVAPYFAWRFAGDYLTAPTTSPDNGTHGRFSTGIVFRF